MFFIYLFPEKGIAKTIKLEKGESYHIKLNANRKIIKGKSKIIKVGSKHICKLELRHP